MAATEKIIDIGIPFEFEAADGTKLLGTKFEPAHPRATVLIHGATAVPQTFYRRFAAHLTEEGYRVLTYDYRGVGASRPESLRGYQATMSDWAELDARSAIVSARSFGDPLLMVGHSFGGQLTALVDEVREAHALLLVGAQLGYYRHWPLSRQAELQLFWQLLLPVSTSLFGYLPAKAGLGEDLPAGVAREWRRWCLSPDYLISHRPDAADRLARFDRPTLSLSFSDDRFAPPRAVDALITRLSSAVLWDKRIVPAEVDLSSIGHFGFFRPANGTVLWHQATAFFDGALTGELPCPPPTKAQVWLDDVMHDLNYGRAF